ncbi:GNAT family N-acetyltransferase [Rickettsia helvetica]
MSNIRIITGIEEYKEWIRVLIRSFGFSDDVYNIYFDNLSKFIGDNKVFVPLTAYEENKIVATASIIFANGIAGFYHDSTMPEYRNRGLASDLYIARFKILKEMGIDKVIIQTSPMATSLAEKLGFKKYTNYKIYCQS